MTKQVQDILLEEGLIDQDTLRQAEQSAQNANEDLGRVLVRMGAITEKDWARARAKSYGIPFFDLAQVKLEIETVKKLPHKLAERLKMIPVSLSDGRLTVAMANPLDVIAIDEARLATGLDIEPLFASEDDLLAAITDYYGIGMSIMEGTGMKELEEAVQEVATAALDENVDTQQIKALIEEAPVVRLVNVIIQQAIRENASDIHVEPLKNAVRIRYRIDGVMHEVMSLPREIHPVLASRLKVMANLDIAERRVPQDGRIRLVVERKEFDFRVSTYPTIFGEKIVLRILDKSGTMVGLDKLGFPAATQAIFEDLIDNPYGILLVTGPTGSGKTTTLYSALNRLNSIEKNIITVEDPIEYQMEGINQMQVNPKAGLRFDNALRAIVRQDPDIIMVGEIRDRPTAEIAINAALTGHLVLSTLHTNDASGAPIRLVDMGVEPYLVASAIIAVLAQRLVRKICTNCKESYKADARLLQRFGYRTDKKEITLYRGKGCELCRGAGYAGRTGVFELMTMDDALRDMVVKRKSSVVIKEHARRLGMKTLQEDCLERVLTGQTSVEEALRIVYVEAGE